MRYTENISKIIIRYSLLLIISSIFITAAHAKDTNSIIDLKLDIFLDKKGSYYLKTSFTNISSEPIEIFKWDLPWISNDTLILVAIEDNFRSNTLKRVSEISDPSSETIIINPKETLIGKNINLNFRFPGLSEALKKNKILLFWYYRAILSKQLKNKPTIGGFIEINNNGL